MSSAIDITHGLRHRNATPSPVVHLTAESIKAARATASHPDMRPAMEQATGDLHAVGTEDEDSKRTILQPTSNPAIAQALATSSMPEFEERLKKVLAGIPGARIVATRDFKNPERLAQKINGEGHPAETINDYGACQVSVDTVAAKDAVVAAVRKEFPIVKEKDLFDKGDDEYHFHHVSLQVQMPSHGTIELQIVPKEVMDANPDQHKNYKAGRDAQISGNTKAHAWQASVGRRKNDAAMGAFHARNGVGENEKPQTEGGRGQTPEQAAGGGTETASAPQTSPAPSNDVAKVEVPPLASVAKGSSVVHHDGTAGTVQWSMGGKARFKTLDGGRRDAPLKELTSIPAVEKSGGSWIGVDLDATAAHYEGFKGPTVIGEPVPAMVDRMKKWLTEGKDVRIFTARIANDPTGAARKAINTWTEKHIGRRLPITNVKDSKMVQLWDDRAVQVEPNTGKPLGDPKIALTEAKDGAERKIDLSHGLKPKPASR